MTPDPRTPVLVGAGTATGDVEPVDLMVAALETAASDPAVTRLLARADEIRVPKGTWGYADPARLIGERVGALSARTHLADLGILQSTVVNGAARAIAAGEAEVVLVAGGEASNRARLARKQGREAAEIQQGDVSADVVVRPHAPVISAAEIDAGLVVPAQQYALIDNALRQADGQSIEQHRAAIDALWDEFRGVGETNPDAWMVPGRDEMFAFPYEKRHCSQMNVDQAAGLVLVSAAVAAGAGVPSDQWVFPRYGWESNHMVPVTERAEMHRCPALSLARKAIRLDEIDHIDLYSCFPSAVRVQARELGLDDRHPLTVTGGMAFAGGPLNNYVLQSTVKMVELIREQPESLGLVTAVSGMLTKQGLTVWGGRPDPAGFRLDDLTDAAAAATETIPVVGAGGPGRVASYTVVYDRGEPARAVILVDLDAGGRAIVTATEPETLHAMTTQELIGQRISA